MCSPINTLQQETIKDDSNKGSELFFPYDHCTVHHSLWRVPGLGTHADQEERPSMQQLSPMRKWKQEDPWRLQLEERCQKLLPPGTEHWLQWGSKSQINNAESGISLEPSNLLDSLINSNTGGGLVHNTPRLSFIVPDLDKLAITNIFLPF